MKSQAHFNLAESFYNHCYEHAHPHLKEWLHPEEIFNPIMSYLDLEFQQVDNPNFAEQYKLSFPDIPAPASLYQNQIIEIEAEKFILAGIRFKGLNPEKPFVDIISNYELIDDEALQTLLCNIQAHFEVFKPIAIRFWDTNTEAKEFSQNPGFKIDQFYLANLVKHIKRLPLPNTYDDLELKPIFNLDFYPEYQKTYLEFQKHSPKLALEVLINTKEEFEESINAKLAFEIFYKNQWAGIIAAIPSEFRELSGYCVLEEIITPSFQGNNLALSAQKQLIHHLPDSALFWGSIHKDNIPSIKTAKRAGRVNVLECVFIDTNYPDVTDAFIKL